MDNTHSLTTSDLDQIVGGFDAIQQAVAEMQQVSTMFNLLSETMRAMNAATQNAMKNVP